MITGLYAAASGMHAMEMRQDVVANNIANASTPGFRAQRTADRGFYQLLYSGMRHPFWANRVLGPGGGMGVMETYTDLRPGPVSVTGNPLSVALEGPGYIAVQTPAGERYTRNGQFTVSADGQLVTRDGHVVLDAGGGGGIDVRGGRVEISEDGRVLLDGALSGTIRVVEFPDPRLLTREGSDLYAPTQAAQQQLAPAADTRVIAESVEYSNVQAPYEMTQMTLGMRAYAANQRVINAIDETVARLIDQVGTPT